MPNSSDPLAQRQSIHGTNPESLVEKIVRYKIHESTYWKKHCFGLTAETLVDRAMELDHTGGTHGGNRKPTPFICLALKMLEIQPEKDIVVEFIKNEDYKYVRVLGAFYLRLTGTNADVYQYLEPLYNDYRKIRQKLEDGRFSLTHVDEFIDELLTKDYCCDTALPRIQKRWVLEACGTLEPRVSALADDFEEDTEEIVQPMDLDEPSTPEKKERDRGRKHELHHRDRDWYCDRDYGNGRGRRRDTGLRRDRENDRDRNHYRIRDDDYSRHIDRYRKRERDHEEGEQHKRCGRARASLRVRAEDDGPSDELRERKEKKKKKGAPDPNDPEIIAMNKLRSSIGLKPLM